RSRRAGLFTEALPRREIRAMTPKRNTYWFLDYVTGWRESSRDGVAITATDGYLTLDPLPGSAVFLDAALASGIHSPVALASDPSGRVVVLNAADSRVTALDLTAKI